MIINKFKKFLNTSRINKFNFILIFSIFVMQFNNFFLNVYIVLKKNYEERMILAYGYCDKQGYGFVKKINDEFNISNNVKIINYDNKYPSSNIFINQFHDIENYQYLILLNNYENNNFEIEFNKIKDYQACSLYKKK
jgi:hypothetical protein